MTNDQPERPPVTAPRPSKPGDPGTARMLLLVAAAFAATFFIARSASHRVPADSGGKADSPGR